MGLSLHQILHAAAENLGNTVKCFGARFVDIFVTLLIHLDGAQRNAGAFGKLGLCASIGIPEAFQVGIFEMLPYYFIHDVHKFCDVRFMKRVVHVFHVFIGQNLKDVTIASCGKPLIVAERPADPVFP